MKIQGDNCPSIDDLRARINCLIGLVLIESADDCIPAQTRLGARSSRKRNRPYVSFSAEESRAYNDVLTTLSAMREAEWCDPGTRDRLLWALTSEAVFHRRRFRDQGYLASRVEKLITWLLHPLVEFTVLLALKDFEPPEHELIVWDAVVVRMSDRRFRPYLESDRFRAVYV